jgi:hypothetical protein
MTPAKQAMLADIGLQIDSLVQVFREPYLSDEEIEDARAAVEMLLSLVESIQSEGEDE